MQRVPLTIPFLLLAAAACDDSSAPISVIDEPPDAGCIRPAEPSTFAVFFVLDVSGSMEPFLRDLSNQLVSFSESIPERDAEGRRTRVDYWVIAFVNDVKVFGGGRMTSIIAIQDAFDQAIEAGGSQYNLTVRTFNSEPEENTLDALAEVVTIAPDAEAKLIMLATDAAFVEAPGVLSENVLVKSTYQGVLADLGRIGARVHAFTPAALDGVTREYRHMPPLTSLPGSTVHRLQDLEGSNDKIRETLRIIAREASCN